MAGEYDKRRSIRTRLSNHHLTQTWLITRLSRRGMIVDSARISKVLSGTVQGPCVNQILDASLDILDEYEQYYGE